MIFYYQRRIYLSDTDAAGVMYFARGLEICHEAYEEFLVQVRVDLNQMIQDGKTILPIVHAEIDFLRPLFCGDLVQVNVTASLISNSELTVAYQISLTNNLEQIAIKAQTRHVCINPQTRKRMNVPPEIQEWLSV